MPTIREYSTPYDKRQTGLPGDPARTLFRALLLGLWYDLGDVKLSQQFARDLLFRKFCRLELDQGVPEASMRIPRHPTAYSSDIRPVAPRSSDRSAVAV